MDIVWDHCPICESRRVVIHDDIGKCSECSHGFRVHVPKEIKPHYYDRQYWNDDKNRQGIMTLEEKDGWEKWLHSRLRIMRSFGLIDTQHSEKQRILEFGCSEGMLLHKLHQMGYEVMGEDICNIAEEGQRAYGFEISQLPIEEFVHLDYKFDLIMSWHVVEHLRDPLSVMRGLADMLLPNGKILLHVPVDDAELDNGDHFHFFTDKSCRVLMEQVSKDVTSDFSRYSKSSTKRATAATYVGTKQ